MQNFVASTIVLVVIWASLVLLIRSNLAQREHARALRAHFIAEANDLVGKADFPEAHARQLVAMARIPQGWLTRALVLVLFKQIIWGDGSARAPAPKIEQVPPHLRAKYVIAMLSFILSDTYRCALLGRVIRGAYSWMEDALTEVKPDVNAHATRTVVEQVQLPRRFQQEPELEMACLA